MKEQNERNTYTRRRISFWLDEKIPDERALIRTIGLLKMNRQFSKTIRDGIAIVWALRRNDINVLVDRFPYVIQKIADEYFLDEIAAERKCLEKEQIQIDAERKLLATQKQELADSLAGQVGRIENLLHANLIGM